MKTLVYENYNKFINATDIVKKVNINVDSMNSNMETLIKKMNGITDATFTIHSEMTETRTKIHNLSGVHMLLKKVTKEIQF